MLQINQLTVLADTTTSASKIEEFYVPIVSSNYGREFFYSIKTP